MRRLNLPLFQNSSIGSLAGSERWSIAKRIFEDDPDLKKLFYFADEGRELSREDQRMRSHGERVMEAVGAAVDNLGDLSPIVPVLTELGALHYKYGVQPNYFDTVGAALIYTLETNLGDKMTPDVRQGWVQVYGIVGATMKKGMQQAMDQQNMGKTCP
ncbi:NGB [Branchiostoma lanceolatum]|uniref:NGB protein n=1 Tax=Branchiostoma lanceolatum TaxID=7740 RepID=A0A8J9ZYQ4_BRALA|nr:NGB [Branchiostoma lanceolatum]